MTSPIISYALASQNPERLANFYGFVIDGHISHTNYSDYFEISTVEPSKIQVYRPSSNQSRVCPSQNKSGSLCIEMPCAKDPLSKLMDLIHELTSKGGSILVEPVLESFGAEAWLVDPDGNSFLLLVPRLEVP